MGHDTVLNHVMSQVPVRDGRGRELTQRPSAVAEGYWAVPGLVTRGDLVPKVIASTSQGLSVIRSRCPSACSRPRCPHVFKAFSPLLCAVLLSPPTYVPLYLLWIDVPSRFSKPERDSEPAPQALCLFRVTREACIKLLASASHKPCQKHVKPLQFARPNSSPNFPRNAEGFVSQTKS